MIEMRYRGRIKVNKVDKTGKKITGKLKTWIHNHPEELYFDSMVEWECWYYLNTTKLKFQYQPPLVLYSGIKTTEYKKGSIVPYSQRSIGYTPDFYLNKYKVYIEVKGFADELFKLRWKLFKLKGYTGYIVYSLKELKSLLTNLKARKI